MLAAIPAATIVLSLMKIDKTNFFQIIGLLLSIIGIGSIISNGDIQKLFL